MTSIARKKLSEKVVEEIRDRLDRGVFQIGEKLPNQIQLSLELGISRTSLREAMHLLDLLGVIEQKPGFGTVIRKRIPDVLSHGITPVLLTDKAATIELLDARLAIEPDIARFTAQNALPDQVTLLKQMVVQMDRVLDEDDYDGFAQLDLNFHAQIADISGNRFLKDVFHAIRQQMQVFINEHTLFGPQVLRLSQKHHKTIIAAIETQAAEMAEVGMHLHIIHLKESYKHYNESHIEEPSDQ